MARATGSCRSRHTCCQEVTKPTALATLVWPAPAAAAAAGPPWGPAPSSIHRPRRCGRLVRSGHQLLGRGMVGRGTQHPWLTRSGSEAASAVLVSASGGGLLRRTAARQRPEPGATEVRLQAQMQHVAPAKEPLAPCEDALVLPRRSVHRRRAWCVWQMPCGRPRSRRLSGASRRSSIQRRCSSYLRTAVVPPRLQGRRSLQSLIQHAAAVAAATVSALHLCTCTSTPQLHLCADPRVMPRANRQGLTAGESGRRRRAGQCTPRPISWHGLLAWLSHRRV